MATAAPLPEPDIIRRTAEEVVQRPEFQLEPVGDSSASLLELLIQILQWIAGPIKWIFRMTSGLADWMRWPITIGLVLLLLLLVGHIVYTIVTALRGPRRRDGFTLAKERVRRDPAALEREADEAYARQDYITAIRFLFQAVLLWLERYERRKLRAGTTNREYLHRYSNSPISQPMRSFVETIDVKWYGRGACSLDDYETCRLAHAEIRRLARERQHAHSA